MERRRKTSRREPYRILDAGGAVELVAEPIEVNERPAVALGIAFASRHQPRQIIVGHITGLDIRPRRAMNGGKPAAGDRHGEAADRNAGSALGLADHGANDRLGFIEIGQHTSLDALRTLQAETRKPQRRLRRRREQTRRRRPLPPSSLVPMSSSPNVW